MTSSFSSTVSYLKNKIHNNPKVAIILGTGLNEIANELDDKIEIPYENIPGFVKSTAPYHHGKMISGILADIPIVVLKGRYHFYEGYTMEQVVYPVRILKLLGIQYLFVTNAAGSLNINLKPGQLVRITDHINMFGTNPLIGKNTLDALIEIDGNETFEFGERFPSQHEPYDPTLADIAIKVANENNISLQEGVYCGVTGPTLETRAECLMIKGWGADLVGMSTIPEVITALHCGMKTLAISVVTNLSNIFHLEAHTQKEIQVNAKKASNDLLKLFSGILLKLME
jgi:purine-nucleoside phosphorylase